MSIYNKLNVIQAKLNAPKGQFNKFGNYAYRNAEDILAALKPLLATTQTTIKLSDEVVQIDERYYIKATATLTDIETNETESATAFAREEETKKGMDSSQITGSASSYARKYALNGLFGIDDIKDSDGTNTHDKEEKPTEPKVAKPKVVANQDLIDELMNYLEMDELVQVLNHFKVSKLE